MRTLAMMVMVAGSLATARAGVAADAAGATAAMPTPETAATPAVTVTVESASVNRYASIEDGTWKSNDVLTLGLRVTADSVHPVLSLETLPMDSIVDDHGTNLAKPKGVRHHGTVLLMHQWRDRNGGDDPTLLSGLQQASMDIPQGRLRIHGRVRVVIAIAPATDITVPIDHLRHEVPVGDTGMTIEVGRHDGGNPSIALSAEVGQHLSAFCFADHGQPIDRPSENAFERALTHQFQDQQHSGGTAFPLVEAVPDNADGVILTIQPRIATFDVPYTLGPLDLDALFASSATPAKAATRPAPAIRPAPVKPPQDASF